MKNLEKIVIHSGLFFILAIGTLVRLNSFYAVSYTEDGSQDYLIARHIIKYHEYPLIGPISSGLGIRSMSPAYDYFLSLFLLIKDDIFTLGIVNLILQLLNIIIIFLLAKLMFGPTTALLSAFLFSFNQTILSQSNYLWQAYFMQPFANLSYLFLVFSYIKKSFLYLCMGIFTFIFAAILYGAVFALLPCVVILVSLILRSQKRPFSYYVFAGLLFLDSLFVAYFPVLYFYAKNNFIGLTNNSIQFSLSWHHMANNFLDNLHIFISTIFINESRLIDYITIVIAITCGSLYLLYNRRFELKIYVVIILAMILEILIATSVLNLNNFRYFIPIFGIFIILVAALINFIFSKNFISNIARVICIIIVTNLSFHNLNNQITYSFNAFRNQPSENPAIAPIQEEILSIKQNGNTDDFNFFDIISYKNKAPYPYVNAAFWAKLEKNFDSKLGMLNDNYPYPYNYQVLSNKKYIFLNCYLALDNNQINNCQQTFLSQNSNYRMVKPIYTESPFYLYLFRKI